MAAVEHIAASYFGARVQRCRRCGAVLWDASVAMESAEPWPGGAQVVVEGRQIDLLTRWRGAAPVPCA